VKFCQPGSRLALLVVALTGCGSDSTELPVVPAAPDPVLHNPPQLQPVPVFPAAPSATCNESRLTARDLAGICRANPPTMGALEAP